MKQLLTLLLLGIHMISFSQVYTLEEALELEQANEKLTEGARMAKILVSELVESKYEGYKEFASEELQGSLSPSQLIQTFESLMDQYGPMQQTDKLVVKLTAENSYTLSEVLFGEENFDVEIGLDESLKISSLMLKPAVSKTKWQSPDYAAKDYESKRIMIPNIELNAELVRPLDNKLKSCVVMVHGSGPNDMDGTVGPNKVFKDLALGLANKGIASLRYNKRTFDYPFKSAKKMNELTIEDIVSNDAIEVVNFARTMGFDKVFLVGHSLGGHMAPQIASKCDLEGVIVMAGNSSPLVDLIVPQFEHLLANDPETQITEFQLNAIRAQTDMVKNKNYNASTPAMMFPLSLPYAFWNSLAEYSPTGISKKLKSTPFLILNGERDYQVTPEEARAWKNGNKNKSSKTIIYPKMNHLFYEGDGILLPSEYEKEAHVDEQVIIDISNWIMSL